MIPVDSLFLSKPLGVPAWGWSLSTKRSRLDTIIGGRGSLAGNIGSQDARVWRGGGEGTARRTRQTAQVLRGLKCGGSFPRPSGVKLSSSRGRARLVRDEFVLARRRVSNDPFRLDISNTDMYT